MAFDPFADYLGLGDLLETSGQPEVLGHWSRYRKTSSDTSSSGDMLEVDITPTRGIAQRHSRVGQVTSPRASESRCTSNPPDRDDVLELVQLMKKMLTRQFQTSGQGLLGSYHPRGPLYCAFCRQNGETRKYYLSHGLKDRFGNVICPVLRAYVCPLCNATGDEAHTLKYCPLGDQQASVPLAKALRSGRNCSGQKRSSFHRYT
ncbi:nanos homolog 3-like [Liolophura sinensis]|uniref:nanos homolog 3-like n=1 Tax=Liolophura sinensis TaxID=3198878 RepID=UPI0031596B8D